MGRASFFLSYNKEFVVGSEEGEAGHANPAKRVAGHHIIVCDNFLLGSV